MANSIDATTDNRAAFNLSRTSTTVAPVASMAARPGAVRSPPAAKPAINDLGNASEMAPVTLSTDLATVSVTAS